MSQYGVGIVFLLGFGRFMQYPSMFHGECKYPKMMQVLHLNSITLSNCEELCNTLIYLNKYVAWYSEHGINIFFLKKIVSWFTILSQNDVGIIFFLGFVRAMEYPSKF